MVRGAVAYHQSGLDAPKAVEQVVQRYRKDMNVVALWIEEACDLDDDARTPRAELRRMYAAWAEDAGYPVFGQKRFSQELQRQGFALAKIKGEFVFAGLRRRTALSRPGLKVIDGGAT